MAQILSLDDDPQILELLGLIFEQAGHDCLTTTDGEQALRVLKRGRVDLFTQDFMRPELDGCQMLRLLKADVSLRQIPVLAITAGTRRVRAWQMQQAGLDLEADLAGFINKPFTPGDLMEAVEAILVRYGKPLPPAEIRQQAVQRWKL